MSNDVEPHLIKVIDHGPYLKYQAVCSCGWETAFIPELAIVQARAQEHSSSTGHTPEMVWSIAAGQMQYYAPQNATDYCSYHLRRRWSQRHGCYGYEIEAIIYWEKTDPTSEFFYGNKEWADRSAAHFGIEIEDAV